MRGRAVLAGAALVVVAASGLTGTSQAAPATSWTLSPPGVSALDGGAPEAHVALTGGKLTLSVTRGATTVLEPSALGVETEEGDLTSRLQLTGFSQRQVVDDYTTTTGKRLQHHYDAAETTIGLRGAGGQKFSVVVRVSHDGVAYRYVFDTQKWVTVLREASDFAVPQSADSFLLPWDNGRSDYENIHVHRKVADQDPIDYGYPALFHVGDSWLALTESDLNGSYGGSRVTLTPQHRFQLTLPDPDEAAKGPLSTPWRAMIVGDLATVTESDMSSDLASPSKIADTSWIKSGAGAWSWWSEGTGNLALQERYVDLAAKEGWAYDLVDSGWDASWVPDLVKYAAAKHVGIWLWDDWKTVNMPSERARLFPQYKAWGVVGLKIDFVESDGQDRMRGLDGALADLAANKLMVNFHGAPIPRGMQRTWPNMLSAEAVKGAEGIKPKPGKVPYPLDHYLTLPFTRNLSGSMDFTPVTFSAVRSDSDAGELALSILFESGAQHFADSIASYDAHPLAEQWLKDIPAAWDDTKLVAGDPGKLAIIARRSGSQWYVGALENGPATRLDAPLTFLPSGDWLAEIYGDGADGQIQRTTQRVTSGATLTMPVAANGGFTARFCQAPAGASQCP